MHNRFGHAPLLALALLGGLCLVASSSSAVAGSGVFVDEDYVYDTWKSWLESHGDDYPYSSASEIWDTYHDGFHITYAWDGTRETLQGVISSSNRFVWLGSYPVALVDWRGDVAFPETFADMLSFQPSNLTVLAFSSWDYIADSLRPVPTNLPASPGFQWFESPVVHSVQPNGKLKMAAVQMTFSNAPLGYITGELMQAPFWHGSRLDVYVTPLTYYDITGEWPSDNEDKPVILMKQAEWKQLLDNQSIRIKERWR